MAEPTKNGSVVSFAKLASSMETPHFLDVQIQAFERLLEPDTETDRRDVGLDRVFAGQANLATVPARRGKLVGCENSIDVGKVSAADEG